MRSLAQNSKSFGKDIIRLLEPPDQCQDGPCGGLHTNSGLPLACTTPLCRCDKPLSANLWSIRKTNLRFTRRQPGGAGRRMARAAAGLTSGDGNGSAGASMYACQRRKNQKKERQPSCVHRCLAQAADLLEFTFPQASTGSKLRPAAHFGTPSRAAPRTTPAPGEGRLAGWGKGAAALQSWRVQLRTGRSRCSAASVAPLSRPPTSTPAPHRRFQLRRSLLGLAPETPRPRWPHRCAAACRCPQQA